MSADVETTIVEGDPGDRVSETGPGFFLGIEYHPIDDERRSWSDAYDKDVEEDFGVIREAGLDQVRVFVSWRAMEPQVGQYDSVAEERLDRVVAAAGDAGLSLAVCFFAEDDLSEGNGVQWGSGRDPRTDGYLIQREVALVQRIVGRYRAESQVVRWELGNEPFVAAFSTPQELEEWVRALKDAIREVDEDRPVALGVDPETVYLGPGLDVTGALDLLEAVTSHVTTSYRTYAAEGLLTAGPATHLTSYLVRSAGRGLPVIADSVGPASGQDSLADEAAYVRTCLFSAFMNGAAGALLRRFRDVDVERREPYFRDPWEVLLGIVDSEGSPKPAVREVRRASEVLTAIALGGWTASPEKAAVLVPAERKDPEPSLARLYTPRACLHAFICSKEAHVPVDVVHEEDRFGPYLLLIVPSVASLKKDTWERVAEFVQSGGTLVYSYGGGELPEAARDLFGVEFQGDGGHRDTLSCRVAQQGVIPGVESFDVSLEMAHFAQLGAGRASVVATEADGSPLLTLDHYGQGTALFLAAPLERALGQADTWTAPAEVRTLLRGLYAVAAGGAGAGGTVSCDVPEVEVALLDGDGEDVLMLLNHSPRAVTAQITMARSVTRVSDVRGGAEAEVGGYTFGVPLRSNGVAPLRVSYTGRDPEAPAGDAPEEG